MTTFKIRHDVKLAVDKIKRATSGQKKSYLAEFERRASTIFKDMERQVKKDISSPWTEGRSLNKLYKRKGDLLRALETSVRGPSKGLSHEVTAEISLEKSDFAQMHEFGTVGAGGQLPDIKPTTRDFLWIPARRVLDPRGIATVRPGETPSGFAFTKKIKFTASRGAFYGRREGSRKWEMLWVLRKSVAIPPRPILAPAVKSARSRINDALLESVKVAFK